MEKKLKQEICLGLWLAREVASFTSLIETKPFQPTSSSHRRIVDGLPL